MPNRSSWLDACEVVAIVSGLCLAILICLAPIYLACRTGSEFADNLYGASMCTSFIAFIIFGLISQAE